MPRQTATNATNNAKPLSLAERKARVAAIAKTARGKAKAGMKRIDFREPTVEERAFGLELEGAARRALARRAKRAA